MTKTGICMINVDKTLIFMSE